MERKSSITLQLSLYDLVARGGEYQTVFRSSLADKQDVEAAARLLHMSSSQYIRMIVVQASRKILAEVA